MGLILIAVAILKLYYMFKAEDPTYAAVSGAAALRTTVPGTGAGSIAPVAPSMCGGLTSKAVVGENIQRVLGVGQHPIGRTDYTMKIYPPLRVVATGPTGHRQEMTFVVSQQECTFERLVLDSEKTYDLLTLSAVTTPTNLTKLADTPHNADGYEATRML
jgi:hypothetical protein